MDEEVTVTNLSYNTMPAAVNEYAYKGRATSYVPCTETWTADTLEEAKQWEAKLRATGVTDITLESGESNDPAGYTHVHMRGTLKQWLLHFGATYDLEEKVFQQFEDGSEGEYSEYWSVICQVLMEWAAERGRLGLPATLKDI